jgi:hypothetical protein
MKPAAIGVRMHSGWGALVAVSFASGKVEIIERRRIVVIDAAAPGAKQPYHFAKDLGLPRAEKFIGKCFADSQQLAASAIRDLLAKLTARKYRVKGAAVVLASGRPLPPVAKILAAHPLLHTAEGQFFREVFAKACEICDLRVEGVRERDLDERLQEAFGKAATRVCRQVAEQRRVIGAPWTADQKLATVAALLVLGRGSAPFRLS